MSKLKSKRVTKSPLALASGRGCWCWIFGLFVDTRDFWIIKVATGSLLYKQQIAIRNPAGLPVLLSWLYFSFFQIFYHRSWPYFFFQNFYGSSVHLLCHLKIYEMLNGVNHFLLIYLIKTNIRIIFVLRFFTGLWAGRSTIRIPKLTWLAYYISNYAFHPILSGFCFVS